MNHWVVIDRGQFGHGFREVINMKNGKKRNRSGWPGYQGAWLIGALVCLTVVGDCGAAEGMFEGMFNKLGLSGAAKMSDVAVKIAEIKDSINVNGLDFSPDGKHLATSSYAQSNEVHVWDWQARKIVLKMNREGSAGLISEGIRYSPDGRFLAVCHDRSSKPHIIHVFDARSGQLVKEINDSIPGGGANAIGFTPDGEWMLRITRRGPIRGDNLIVYSTRTWEPSWGVVTDPMDTNAMTISPDGRYVAIGGIDLGPGVPHQPRILIVDLQQRQVVKSIATFPIKNAIERIAWSPDEAQIAAGASVGGSYLNP